MRTVLLKLNELIINGKSSSGFPFYVAIEKNAPPIKAKKKDKIFKTDYANGSLKQSVSAYDTVTRPYTLYVHDATHKQLRELKAWVSDNGWFTPYDEPDLKFYYDEVEFESKELDKINGYEITLTFECQPFGMEEPRTTTLGNSIANSTNAPMYPRITIRGNSATETFLTIGQQTMRFKSLTNYTVIECQHGKQDVWTAGGKKLNGETKGDFFEIQPGTHSVSKGAGITSIEIIERWGWR